MYLFDKCWVETQTNMLGPIISSQITPYFIYGMYM